MTKHHGLSTEDRFWKKVDKKGEDECWNWTKGCGSHGYGQLRDENKVILVHRYSYELHKGPIPDDKEVCHTCVNNRRCVNPKHLYAGTHEDNMKQAVREGRLNNPIGDRHPSSKLTSIEIEEIRKLLANGSRTKDIAKAYSISDGHVSNIKAGRIWKNMCHKAL